MKHSLNLHLTQMFSVKIIFSILTLIISSVICDETNPRNVTKIVEKESNVLILNNSNFNETLDSYEFVFVNFYLERCQHKQKDLNCEFDAAADIMAEEDVNLKLAKVNGDKEKELGIQNNIRIYPTMLLFKNQTEPVKYVGFCKAENIAEWLKLQTIVPTDSGTKIMNNLFLNILISSLLFNIFS